MIGSSVRRGLTQTASGHDNQTAHRKSVGILGYLIVGYVFFLPVQFNSNIGFRIAPSDVFLLAFVLLSLPQLRVIPRAWTPSLWALPLMFAAGALVATLRTGEITRYAIVNKEIGLVLLLSSYLALTSFAVSWERVRWLLRVFILAVVLNTIVGVGEFAVANLSGYHVSWLNFGTDRVAGLLVDPNAFGGLLVVALVILLAGSYARPRLVNPTWGLVTALILVTGIILTSSRSAWLGLAVALLIIVAWRPRLVLRLGILSAIAGVALLAIFGMEFFQFAIDLATRQTQIGQRADQIGVAYSSFQQSPIWGVGLGTVRSEGLIVHNTVGWFAGEFGLIGIIVFTGLAFGILLKGVSAYALAERTYKPLILGLILAHVVMLGFSLGIEALYQRHWWLVMALIGSSYVLVKQHKEYAGNRTGVQEVMEGNAGAHG